MWNVCRFLRDLAERDSVEMLIHDGMLIKHAYNDFMLFYPDFEWFCDVISECVKQRARFKMLIIGGFVPYTKIEPLYPGSLILKGVVSVYNSIRIYSSVGAREVLKRIRGQVAIGRFDADQVLLEPNPEREPICWSLPGTYTLLMKNLACDMPGDYLGSDSVNNMQTVTEESTANFLGETMYDKWMILSSGNMDLLHAAVGNAIWIDVRSKDIERFDGTPDPRETLMHYLKLKSSEGSNTSRCHQFRRDIHETD